MIEDYRQGNHNSKPTIRSYSGVLNACAFTPMDKSTNQEKTAAFKIARECFKEILSDSRDERPNSMAFSQFIASCLNLVAAGTKRDQLVASVFEECCRQGLVDIKIILEIRRSSPMLKNHLLESVGLADGIIRMEDIPREWRCNIRHTSRR